MNSQQYLQKAKKSARNQFILTVFCVELLFILVAILWSLATGLLFVSIVTAFFCLIVPIAAFIEWNKEIDKSKIFRVNPTCNSVPYSPKFNLPGAKLTFNEDGIHWVSKQRYEKREVAYADVIAHPSAMF